jgi:hypothetical protein
MTSFPERDWKVLRVVGAAALERFCERALDDVRHALAEPGATAADRLFAIHDLVRASAAEHRRVFGDVRRSRALDQILMMRSAGLLEPTELAQFSDETRHWGLDRREPPARSRWVAPSTLRGCGPA